MKEVKKVLIGLISIIVLLVVADWSVGTWSEKMYLKSKYSIYHKQLYCLNESQDEVLIMGSSRAAHHYVPQIIEDSLGMTCYNAGSDGECIYYHFCLLSAMIERGAKPKMVIYEVMNLDAEVSGGATFTLDAALDRLAPHYGEYEAIDSLVALNGWKEKVKMLSKTYRYNSKLVQTIKCNYLPEKEDKGYEALTGKMNVELYEKDAATRTSNPKKSAKIEDRKLGYMEKFIRLCTTNGINLLLCYSPYYHNKPSGGICNIQEMADNYNVPFCEFATDEEFDNPELFNDAMHLNDDGAREYTAKLVGIIKKNNE